MLRPHQWNSRRRRRARAGPTSCTEFSSPWWLPGGHLQTIYPSLRPPPRVELRRERWETPDGDFIDVDFAGASASDTERLLVLFHGLEGGSDSHYARAICTRAAGAGVRVALPHWRGCSGEPNRTARAYHSGDSEEVDWILRRCAESSAQLFAAGVSLGGNALLKWLGERSGAASALLRRAAAVSAPIDLPAAGQALDRGMNRLLYTRMFLSTLKPKTLAKLEAFPGLLDSGLIGSARTFRQFDNLVTAPLHGFRDVDHYWTSCASGPWLQHVRVPTLLLNARNDPFLPEQALLAAARRASSSVLLEFPRTGGHVGFVSGPFPGRQDWLPQRLFQFLFS
jgi:uncharacterized protein